MQDIAELIGKAVEVTANGMSYRGTLIEVSDTEVHLKSALQWISLPVSGVTDVKPADRAGALWNKTFDVAGDEERKDTIP